MKLGWDYFRAAVRGTIKGLMKDDLTGLAAEVAYHLLFAIVPLMIFFTALAGMVGRWIGQDEVVGSITGWLQAGSNLPPETIVAVIEPIEAVLRERGNGLLSFGALVALWSGKNAMTALMKALNVAYGAVETRPWWKRTAIAIGLTVGLGSALIGASVLFLAGSWLGERGARWLGVSEAWTTLWAVARWPLILMMMTVALAVLYWAGPNVASRWRWMTPGAVTVIALWALATAGLGAYFRYFGGFLTTYGVLGGVLAFMLWLYVMNLILLIGGETNAMVKRRSFDVARET